MSKKRAKDLDAPIMRLEKELRREGINAAREASFHDAFDVLQAERERGESDA